MAGCGWRPMIRSQANYCERDSKSDVADPGITEFAECGRGHLGECEASGRQRFSGVAAGRFGARYRRCVCRPHDSLAATVSRRSRGGNRPLVVRAALGAFHEGAGVCRSLPAFLRPFTLGRVSRSQGGGRGRTGGIYFCHASGELVWNHRAQRRRRLGRRVGPGLGLAFFPDSDFLELALRIHLFRGALVGWSGVGPRTMGGDRRVVSMVWREPDKTLFLVPVLCRHLRRFGPAKYKNAGPLALATVEKTKRGDERSGY